MHARLVFAGNFLLCSNATVHLHAGENGDGCPAGADGHEGLHIRPGDPGDSQHPQSVHEAHRPHGCQPDAGKHYYAWFLFSLT